MDRGACPGRRRRRRRGQATAPPRDHGDAGPQRTESHHVRASGTHTGEGRGYLRRFNAALNRRRYPLHSPCMALYRSKRHGFPASVVRRRHDLSAPEPRAVGIQPFGKALDDRELRRVAFVASRCFVPSSVRNVVTTKRWRPIASRRARAHQVAVTQALGSVGDLRM